MSAEAAFCNGMIDALLYLRELLPRDICYAVPVGIPRHRVVQAIVNEIEPLYPSIEAQHFRGLAIEVLHYKWPCHYAGGWFRYAGRNPAFFTVQPQDLTQQ